MKECLLKIVWRYTYDKEGTWFDEDEGEDLYPLIEGEKITFRHIPKKPLTILSVCERDGVLTAELCEGTRSIALALGGEAVKYVIDDSYMVCGDFVSQSLYLTLSIVEK